MNDIRMIESKSHIVLIKLFKIVIFNRRNTMFCNYVHSTYVSEVLFLSAAAAEIYCILFSVDHLVIILCFRYNTIIPYI